MDRTRKTRAGWYAKRAYGKSGRPTDLVIDSTGMKVYGEGEWKRQKHGTGKRSVWLKAHLAVDPATNLIKALSGFLAMADMMDTGFAKQSVG